MKNPYDAGESGLGAARGWAGVHAGDLESVFDELTDGLILSNAAGDVVHWNRAALAMHEFDTGAAVTRPLEDFLQTFELATLDGQVLPFERWPLPRALRGETVRDLVLELRRRERSWHKTFRYTASVLRDLRGEITLAVLHVSDVTPQRLAAAAAGREVERQTLLLACSRRLLDASVVDAATMHALFDGIRDSLGLDAMFHYRLATPEGPLELVSAAGVTDDALLADARVVPLGASICSAVAGTKTPIVASSDRIRDDPLAHLVRRLGARAYACYPLLGQSGAALGTLSFASGRRERFEPEEVVFFETLSHMVSVALERSIAREAVAEREARLRLLLEQLPVSMWSTDHELRFTFATGALLTELGIEPTQLEGSALADAARSDDRELTIARHRDALEGKYATYETSVGSRHLRIALVPLRDPRGDVTGTLGVAVDNTAAKKAERALLEHAEMMTTAQRVGHFGSWELQFDANGAPIEPHYWSEEHYRIYGLEPGVPPMTAAYARELMHPEDRSAFDRIREACERHDPEVVASFRIVRPDGVVRHVRMHARPFVDDRSGRLVKVVATTQDVTEQRLAEEEVRRLNADLERRVTERTAELAAANGELESFAYAVSHDLRSPLRAMAGFSRALLEDYGAQLDDDGRRFLERIVAGSHAMGELIDALLSLSGYTRQEMRHDVVDLSAIAARIVDDLARDEPTRRVDVAIAPGMSASGDARLVEVVLRNLLSNAWKYTIRQAEPRVQVRAETRDGTRYFVVEDNGAGFDMEHASKLFKPFQRLHHASEFPGTGIGLATVQRIVARHGGKVFAESAPGRGASFAFSLERAPAPNRPATATAAPAA